MSKMKRHMESRSLEDIVQELMSVVSTHMDTTGKILADLTECIKALKDRVEILELMVIGTTRKG